MIVSCHMIRDDSLPEGGDLDDLEQNVRVISAKEQHLGTMTLSEAMKIARRERAKLVKIAPTAIPPIYRLVAGLWESS